KRKANQILAEQKEEIETQAEELKTTNEKLVELDGFKEAMTGMVVHDFKNSLNTIINFSEDTAGNSKMRSIRQAGKNMYRLVMNLLDVQKFEDTNVPLSLQDQSIDEVTLKAVDQVRFLMEQKNLKITTVLEGSLTGRFDMELITRVLENLLTNAIKFSAVNGLIHVDAHAENQHIKISISDHGQGISKENLDRVFNKFEQIESKESGVTRSTGLGLTFCKMVVEAHNGLIGVYSEMDKGSTFWFTIPRSDEQEPDLKIAAEIDSPVVDEINLTEEDKSFLRPFQKELNQMNIYEYSRITSVLSQIERGKRPNIDRWIERFEIVLRNMDEQNFREMLNF
ncbi:MAG: HAMP domain-containing histidine kinase, partial [Cyclobacteriaceae bacterium]|nr:HAMP domain-containing histidine kinase [Cyclobacteriaceae bacterium]